MARSFQRDQCFWGADFRDKSQGITGFFPLFLGKVLNSQSVTASEEMVHKKHLGSSNNLMGMVPGSCCKWVIVTVTPSNIHPTGIPKNAGLEINFFSCTRVHFQVPFFGSQ